MNIINVNGDSDVTRPSSRSTTTPNKFCQ